ncbi:MAG: MlaD family protein [Alphaproteobacteria bacterium]|jgi:phospholipid/cholesterol/gamma-HCH transport system substrate-binding protein|nr:MCE family protein [Alphaproteobacteria bacterium]
METRASYIAVGSFILALAVGVLLFIMWISKVDFNQDAQNYLIYFKGSVSGLRENESVKFHGLPIGKVKKIYVDPKDIEQIVVKITVDNPELVREDAVATIEAQGITGYSYIQIKGGSKEKPPLKVKPGKRYPIINSQASGVEMIFSELPHILKNVYDLSARLNRVLDDHNITAIGQTLENISRLSKDLSQGPERVQTFVKEARLGFRQLRESLQSLEKQVSGWGPSVKAFGEASKSLDKTAATLDGLLSENRGAFKDFTGEGLPSVAAAMKEAQRSLKALQSVLADVEISPGDFLHKSPHEGYKLPQD